MVKHERWTDRHGGVFIEVNKVPPTMDEAMASRLMRPRMPLWTGYIHPTEERFGIMGHSRNLALPTDSFTTLVWSAEDFLCDAPVNGGISYLNRSQMPNGMFRWCLGWDYDHLWDNEQDIGNTLTPEQVIGHAKRFIDWLKERRS